MKFSFTFYFVFLLSFLALPQENDEKDLFGMSLEELLDIEVDIASNTSNTVFESPSAVSVIDRDFINRFNIKSVPEAISLLAAVSVQRTYLKRDIPVIRGILQDHYANKVLILLNGIPAWNAVTGEGNLDRIDINSVERIEVLKGPASVLYGTNAYSGAINIVLKSKENLSSGNFGIGSNGSFNAGGMISYSKDDFSFFASGNASSNTGKEYFIIDEAGVSGYYDEFMRNRNFTFSIENKNHSLFFNAAETKESFLGVEPTFAAGLGTYHLINNYLAGYRYNSNIFSNLSVNYSFVYDYSLRSFPRSADVSLLAKTAGFQISNNLGFIYSPENNIKIDFGFDYDFRKSIKYNIVDKLSNSVVGKDNLYNKELYEASFYSQVEYAVYKLKLLLGTRYNYNKLYKNNLSSRAALVYLIDDKNSIKLLWGQSYRAPSLFEFYFENSKTVYGNPNLQPEKSHSFELAYLTSFSNVFAQALVYYAEYKNKIFRIKRLNDPLDKTTIYTNGDKFSAKGFELEVKYFNNSLANFFVNYNYIDGDNGDEMNTNGHYNFHHVPKHSLKLGVSKIIAGINLSSICNFSGAFYGSNSIIKETATLDFNISFTHFVAGKNITHYVSIKNAFDQMVYFAEFSRNNLNQVPSGYGRELSYNLIFSF